MSTLIFPLRKSKIFKTLPKEVWIGWVSSLVEAYNMAIYSFIAPLLAPLLFQHTTAWSAVFFSYSLVLIGTCVMYPAGAVYFGIVGDKKGRQKICIYSTLGLAIATGMMGLFPIHLFGNNTWIYFLILICAQNFFSGGEYHGSTIFSLEHATQKQSGLMSSLSCLFAVFGLVAANGLATLSFLMQNEQWIRICFFIGAAGGLISYLLKNHCQETPVFTAISQDRLEAQRWGTFIRMEWCNMGSVILTLAFFIVSYNFIFIFLPLIPFEQTTIQNFDTFQSLIAYGLLLILSGWIADRVGMQKIMLLGIFIFSIAVIPLCFLCKDLLVLQMILTPCACLVIGPIHSWILDQFDVQNRCRGIFISSAIATSIFGGSTVPICLMIFEWTHSLVMCSIYPLVIAVCTLGYLICFNQIKADKF